MTISNQIIAVLDAICEKFGVVIDWTANNVMPHLQDLCHRVITYEIVTSAAWIVLQVIVVILAISTRRRIIKADDLNSYDAEWWLVTTACVIIVFVATIVFCIQVFDIIRAFTIPEATIYKFFSSMAKRVAN